MGVLRRRTWSLTLDWWGGCGSRVVALGEVRHLRLSGFDDELVKLAEGDPDRYKLVTPSDLFD